METGLQPKTSNMLYWFLAVIIIVLIGLGLYFKKNIFGAKPPGQTLVETAATPTPTPKPTLNIAAYNTKLNSIANNPLNASGTPISNLWPAQAPYPNYGALLPFNRIVAYYGNLYSAKMGVLGEYSEEIMLNKLAEEVGKWQTADPATPVIPALHYIAVVAQASPGKDGKFRARMPDTEIDKILKMAGKIQALIFLDVQVGLSNVETEIPLLAKYLKMPNVHLGIDPEFAMRNSAHPGSQIGSLDANDVNFAANFLARIVRENNLPPKILIIHRFTRPMLTNFQTITPLPEVQIVINMDGFGSQGSKLNTYKSFIYPEPVQFTGFKLFYKNDLARGPLLNPQQLLKLNPIPVYIQYQ